MQGSLSSYIGTVSECLYMQSSAKNFLLMLFNIQQVAVEWLQTTEELDRVRLVTERLEGQD